MKRGEIWLANLDPTIGSEIKKTRPAIIISSDLVGILPLKVFVPLTDWKDRYSTAAWMVRLEPDEQNKLKKKFSRRCFADSFCFRKKIGEKNRLTHHYSSCSNCASSGQCASKIDHSHASRFPEGQ